MSEFVPRCSEGHDLTPDNIRQRTGPKAGKHECLTCYRAAAAERQRRRRSEGGAVAADRVRSARGKAKRKGLRLLKHNDSFTLLGNNHALVANCTLEEIERLLADGPKLPPGPPPLPPPPEWQPSIDQFVAESHAARRRPETIRTRVTHIVTFARTHSELTPATVQRQDLIAWIGQEQRKVAYARSIRYTMRAFFGVLHELGVRDDNPAEKLPAIRVPRAQPRPCPDPVVAEAYQRTAVDEATLLALRVAVETGMRRFEVAQLRPSDVEGWPGAYAVHVVGKGGDERKIPISDSLAHQLLSIGRDYVFPNRWTGQPISAKWMGKKVARSLPGAEWTAHTLRHRFATIAYSVDRDIRVVQELLGHTSPETTAIYTAVSDDSMRRAAVAAAVMRPALPEPQTPEELRRRAAELMDMAAELENV